MVVLAKKIWFVTQYLSRFLWRVYISQCSLYPLPLPATSGSFRLDEEGPYESWSGSNNTNKEDEEAHICDVEYSYLSEGGV